MVLNKAYQNKLMHGLKIARLKNWEIGQYLKWYTILKRLKLFISYTNLIFAVIFQFICLTIGSFDIAFERICLETALMANKCIWPSLRHGSLSYV